MSQSTLHLQLLGLLTFLKHPLCLLRALYTSNFLGQLGVAGGFLILDEGVLVFLPQVPGVYLILERSFQMARSLG